MNEKTKFAQLAIAREELFEYLVGGKNYGYIKPYADMPTYPSDVFASLIDYHKHSNDNHIWNYFAVGVTQVSADKTYSWLSLYYLVAYLRYITRHQAAKSIGLPDATNLSQAIFVNLKALREFLSHSKRWVGCDYSNGLWGDVERMTRNINEEFNLDLKL
jgi:hypothetical protein